MIQQLIPESLTCVVEDPHPGIVVVRVVGDLRRAVAPRLARVLDAQLDRCVEAQRHDAATADGRAHLVVDLTGVTHGDVADLHVLRHAQYNAEEAGVGFELTGVPATCEHLPGWAERLSERFTCFPSLEDTLATFTRQPA